MKDRAKLDKGLFNSLTYKYFIEDLKRIVYLGSTIYMYDDVS